MAARQITGETARAPASHRSRAGGVSLIEVLVALLVVSLGILAMSGLLTNSTRYGKTSEFRAVATLLANDIADRMRANKAGVTANRYVLNDKYQRLSSPPPVDNRCTEAAPCVDDPATMAAKDLADWKRALYFGLPEGAGYVSVKADDHTAADVWVAWTDPAAVEEVLMAADARDECPDAFADGVDPRPRCIYFRVGL
jgi:type IV pilus assembly protein PilV